jgi:hypothetical protein
LQSAFASAAGVGALLAGDLLRSGSKPVHAVYPMKPRSCCFGAAAQPIVGKPDSYALRAEAISRCARVHKRYRGDRISESGIAAIAYPKAISRRSQVVGARLAREAFDSGRIMRANQNAPLIAFDSGRPVNADPLLP